MRAQSNRSAILTREFPRRVPSWCATHRGGEL